MRKGLLAVLGLLLLNCVYAQKKQAEKLQPVKLSTGDSIINASLKYRLVGPFRGGRSGTATGSFKQKNTFFFGSTGGGVWKTTDGGNNWANISDKYFGGSIGAVTLAPSDENTIYVGEGENTMRGNVSEGLNGMWKSTDGGKTWAKSGLANSRHIVRIVVHPSNPDIVWAAVMGHLFGPNEERGVYKSIDGGKTWTRTLFVNNQTGCSELVIDPVNPMILYAGTWRLIRTPYSLESGGEGSGLWKSVDGGTTWLPLTTKKGLPKGIWGIVGVAVAPSNSDKIYAIIENADGGLFASADGGETWELQSSDNNIRQRAWYYSKIYVDPKNENQVYVMNVDFLRSSDGGKTFKGINTPHGDHHDLWIDPQDPARMIVADDGGAQVSFDGGNAWSTYMNQPTSQIYRVSTDNSFPYRILGAQQDNSTIRIKSATYGNAITEQDWTPTAGSESGYVVADPLNPDIVYGGNYGGYLSRLDHKTGEDRAISVWPDNPMGAGADVLKYRFQWNFPIFFSPHNPKRLYCAGNALFVTENEGASWEQISPDLTTNDKTKQLSSGGPITKDNTSVEYYCTIFTAAESPLEKDLLWTGSDDGLLHISRDGGKNWKNVTPKDCPKWMMWNSIEVDPFVKGGAYATGTRYKSDDYTPYIYKTTDYGQTWKLITNGIAPNHFTRVMRADKVSPSILYAGTEYGMYISYDMGGSWKPFQLNLPIVPITDLTIKNNDLIVATQGRALWVLDDLSIIQQNDAKVFNASLHVFHSAPGWRIAGDNYSFGAPNPATAGTNPPKGAVINYFVKEFADTGKAVIKIFDANQQLVSTYATDSKDNKLAVKKGLNKFIWNLQYPASERIPGMILWNGSPSGIVAIPGQYAARVIIDKDSADVPFEVIADPNFKCSPEDYKAQFDFLKTVQSKFDEVQGGIKDIRSLRTQLGDFVVKQGKDCPQDVKNLSDSISKKLTAVEEKLYQTKAKSFQDVLNFPIRLNDKLAGVFNMANSGQMAPPKQAIAVYDELRGQCDTELSVLKSIIMNDIPKFNQLIREKSLPVISVKK